MQKNLLLKKQYLKTKTKYASLITTILNNLRKIDKEATILSLEDAIASQELIKKLWEFLPDEYEAYKYDGEDEQIAKGVIFLSKKSLSTKVNIHFGWDLLSFNTTLEAAWYAWKYFFYLDSIHTYNNCIYPEKIDWYFIRAGKNLYPMEFNEENLPKMILKI